MPETIPQWFSFFEALGKLASGKTNFEWKNSWCGVYLSLFFCFKLPVLFVPLATVLQKHICEDEKFSKKWERLCWRAQLEVCRITWTSDFSKTSSKAAVTCWSHHMCSWPGSTTHYTPFFPWLVIDKWKPICLEGKSTYCSWRVQINVLEQNKGKGSQSIANLWGVPFVIMLHFKHIASHR